MSDTYRPNYFDPLSTAQIEATICAQLERQPLISLVDPMLPFEGSGLYAIYYIGSTHPLYKDIATYKIPLYAGQARSYSSSTGIGVRDSMPLRGRINEHRRSIKNSRGLVLAEFAARLLCMPDVHADLGENGLRVHYNPVWNAILRGFGSHEQGASTRRSGRSRWDTVHAGRKRTHGASGHDVDLLLAQARDHIERQIHNYPSLPWHTS